VSDLHDVIPTPGTGTPWVPTANWDTVTPIDATHYMVGSVTLVTWIDQPHCPCVTFSFNLGLERRRWCEHIKLLTAYRAAHGEAKAA